VAVAKFRYYCGIYLLVLRKPTKHLNQHSQRPHRGSNRLTSLKRYRFTGTGQCSDRQRAGRPNAETKIREGLWPTSEKWRHLLAGTEEIHEKTQSAQSTSPQKFQPTTSLKRYRFTGTCPLIIARSV